MVTKTELIKWLIESEGTHVGIGEGGLSLETSDGLRKAGAYFEIGCFPEACDFDADHAHPDFPVTAWEDAVTLGETALGYREWMHEKL
jgi:hypothetical protein